jgi:hypothetical protein
VLLRETPAAAPARRPYDPAPTTTAKEHPITAKPAVKPAALTIHYGRTALALVAVLALLTAAVTGVLKLAGVVHALVPLTAALVFVASLVLLRTLAVRARTAKVEAAFRAAMGTAGPRTSFRAASGGSTGGTTTAAGTRARPAPSAAPAGLRTVTVFDADSGAAAGGAGPARTAAGTTAPATRPATPLTAVELRRAALEVAARAAAGSAGESWEPVTVPAPSYVAAAKAERPAPAPLELPEAPKSAGKTSIRATEAGITAPGITADAGQAPRPTHGLSNLDDVLQRRRA